MCALFFGYFLVGKHKKVTCRRATPGTAQAIARPTTRHTYDNHLLRRRDHLRFIRPIPTIPKNATRCPRAIRVICRTFLVQLSIAPHTDEVYYPFRRIDF